MQEKRILPRRRGGVLLCVLGCLFVFFVKTEKDLAAAGNILWTAGYVGSTLLWTVLLGCLLGRSDNRNIPKRYRPFGI